MGVNFGPLLSITGVNVATQYYGSGHRVWRGYYDGSVTNAIKVDASVDQGYSFASSATVDTNAANTGVSLNDPLAVDAVNGKLHILFDRHSNTTSTPAVLLHSVSSDNGATWSAPVVLDDGTAHSNTNGRFYRVAMIAYNDSVSVVYTSEQSVTFTTDGLYETHSSDGGTTWSASASSPTKLYSSAVCPFEPNMVIGRDAHAHLSWYDPGVVSNIGGDLYYAHGTWNGAGWTWDAASHDIGVGEVWGRPRLDASNGVVLLVGNLPFGGNVADMSFKRSADNGATWSATSILATHGSGPLSHPDVAIDSNRALLICTDISTSPLTYFAMVSYDAGVSWSPKFTPFSNSSTSDAPRLVITDDLIMAAVFDNSVVNATQRAFYPLFAPDAPSTPVIDAFNRANENPLSDGGKWTLNTDAGNNCKLVSNQITRQLGAGSFDRSGNYRNDSTTAGAHEVYCDVVQQGGEIDLYLWNPTAPQNGYSLNMVSDDFGTAETLVKVTAGSGSTLISDTGHGLTTGETILLRMDQADVVGMRLTSGNWLECLRATDSTFRSGMRLVIDIAGQAGTPIADNFGGGQLFAPVNNVAPLIYGIVGTGQTLYATYGEWATDLGKTPTKFRMQWQQSTNGGATWTNISLATLKFYTLPAAAGVQYRVQVTGSNSIGNTTATSNVLPGATTYFVTSQAVAGRVDAVVASGMGSDSF